MDFNWLRGLPSGPQNLYGYQGDGGERDQAAMAEYQRMLAQIKQQAGGSWQEAINRGYISEQGQPLNIPHWGPAGDAAKGTTWASMSDGLGGVATDPWSGKPIERPPSATGATYNDPVYGKLYQASLAKPADPWFNLARSLVIGGVTGGSALALAPAIGGALGMGSGANTTIAAILRMLPALAQGSTNYGGMIGSALGGATGIPLGGTIGGIGGGLAQRQFQPDHN